MADLSPDALNDQLLVRNATGYGRIPKGRAASVPPAALVSGLIG
jgi:hypothetical protein